MSKPSWMNSVPAYQFVGSADNPRWLKKSLALYIGQLCDNERQRKAADEVARVIAALRKLVDEVNAESAQCQIWEHPELDTAVDNALTAVKVAEHYGQ